MRVSVMSWRRASIIFCGLLVFGLVLTAGSHGMLLTQPDTVLAGDPEGGDGTPSDPPPAPDPGVSSGATTGDTNGVDATVDRDTLVEQLLVEFAETLAIAWR